MMDINISDILVGVLTILAAMGSWFSKQVWSKINTLEERHQALEIKIAQDYVRHDRLQDAFKPIMDALAEIKETLKTKADK